MSCVLCVVCERKCVPARIKIVWINAKNGVADGKTRRNRMWTIFFPDVSYWMKNELRTNSFHPRDSLTPTWNLCIFVVAFVCVRAWSWKIHFFFVCANPLAFAMAFNAEFARIECVWRVGTHKFIHDFSWWHRYYTRSIALSSNGSTHLQVPSIFLQLIEFVRPQGMCHPFYFGLSGVIFSYKLTRPLTVNLFIALNSAWEEIHRAHWMDANRCPMNQFHWE